jgi:hypothetical protein
VGIPHFVDTPLIPSQRLSSVVMESPFLVPDDAAYSALTDYEYGGAALNDPSQGLQVKVWTLQYSTPDFVLSASGVSPTTVFSFTGVTQVSLAFDQNMRPCIAYVKSGQAWLYWYDTLIENFTHDALDAGIADPRVCLDDKRARQTGSSDIILAYTRNNNLYFRAQRDRFGVEYLLRTDVNALLRKIGMNTGNRLQFQLEATA